MGFLLSKVFGLEKVTRFFFYVHNIIQIFLIVFSLKIISFITTMFFPFTSCITDTFLFDDFFIF